LQLFRLIIINYTPFRLLLSIAFYLPYSMPVHRATHVL